MRNERTDWVSSGTRGRICRTSGLEPQAIGDAKTPSRAKTKKEKEILRVVHGKRNEGVSAWTVACVSFLSPLNFVFSNRDEVSDGLRYRICWRSDAIFDTQVVRFLSMQAPCESTKCG